MMIQEQQAKWFRNKIFRGLVIGFVLAALVSTSLFLIYSPYTLDDGFVVTGSNSPITDHSITNINRHATTDVTFFNYSPFQTTDWSFRSYSIDITTDSLISITNNVDGLHISAKNQVINAKYYLNIPAKLLDTLTLSTFFECKYGSIEVQLTFKIYYSYSLVRTYDTSQQVTVSSTAPISLSISGSQFDSMYSIPSWVVLLGIDLQITVPDHAEFIIKSTTLRALTSEPMIPVIVNTLSDENVNFFEAPASKKCRIRPALNLTHDSIPEFAMVTIMRVNETVYLPIGSYTGKTGWFSSNGLSTYDNLDFILLSDQTVMVSFILPMTRLYLNILPINGIQLIISLDDLHDLYYLKLRTPFPEFIYIPDGVQQMYIYVFVMNGLSWNSISPVSVNINRTYTLSVHWNVLLFGGFILNVGQLFIIMFAISILVVTVVNIQRAAVPIRILNRLHNPRVISAICFITGLLFPWPRAFNQLIDQELLVQSFEFVIPLLMMFVNVRSHDSWTVSFIEITPTTFLGLLLCWIPVTIIIYDLSVNRLNQSVIFSVYAPIGVYSVLYLIFYGCYIYVGVVLLVISFAVQIYVFKNQVTSSK